MLLLAIRAMLEIKTFILRSVWPFPKLTPVMGFWQLQLFLLGVALAVSGMYWLLLGNTNPTSQFLFTFIIGNLTWLVVTLSAPVLLKQRSPWDWITYLAVLLPVAAVASSMQRSQAGSSKAGPTTYSGLIGSISGMVRFSRWSPEVPCLFRARRRGGLKVGIANWKGRSRLGKSNWRPMRPS